MELLSWVCNAYGFLLPARKKLTLRPLQNWLMIIIHRMIFIINLHILFLWNCITEKRHNMNKRDFGKVLAQCTNKKTKNAWRCKIKALPDDVKSQAVYYIVKNRGPIVVEFIPDSFDMSWLACCAYQYTTKGKKKRLYFPSYVRT